MVTDYHITAPTEQFVRAHAERGNTVFRYELQWPSPRAGLGACHDSCLPLVFGNLGTATALADADEAARHMSDAVQSLWLAFVRGQEPWERYDGAGGCRRAHDAAQPRNGNRPRPPRRATRLLAEPLSRLWMSDLATCAPTNLVSVTKPAARRRRRQGEAAARRRRSVRRHSASAWPASAFSFTGLRARGGQAAWLSGGAGPPGSPGLSAGRGPFVSSPRGFP
ncbi:carboxylesterase family protein [Mycolicibacterium austroafricanum]|uniref:Carboxylesterase family protein n=1 Tax=Mycolicibacterium austroafricanum TaxID=39687 RepID=A0ABT8HCR2_MYCAO|nr:carboxylesterase family protein [Mycolicibacterium austroafricanum]MDN4518556.1 carboxylesterase family protein [Mycolicibacterium austroafricanum]